MSKGAHLGELEQMVLLAVLQLKETDERLDELFLEQFSRILMRFFDNPELWNRIGP